VRTQLVNAPMDSITMNLEKMLFYSFNIFCFLPYVNLLRIPTDAQPNALILAIIIFFIGINRFTYPRVAFIILFLMVPFYFLGTINEFKFDFSLFRSLLGYISLFFITLISYVSFKKGYTPSWNLFKYFVILNVIISLLQLVLKINFFEFLFFRVGTSETRGATGLTPEPTFNATIAIFCATIYLLNYYAKSRNFILLLIFFWIVILAQSSTIVLMVVPVLIIYFTLRNFKIFIIPVALILISFYFVFGNGEEKPENSRLVSILSVVATNPEKLVVLDESVNGRISNIIVPAYVSISALMMPHGSNMNFLNKSIPIVTRDVFPNLFYFENIAAGVERIMSGWSMIFYEVGLIGFVFFFYILFVIFFRLDHFGVLFLGSIIFVVVVFTAVTINTSIIPFIFGNIIYKVSEMRQIK